MDYKFLKKRFSLYAINFKPYSLTIFTFMNQTNLFNALNNVYVLKLSVVQLPKCNEILLCIA